MSDAHQGLARSVQVRLVRRAKELGIDSNLVITRYGVERFLYRLSRSLYAEKFVLKGALVLLVWLGETLRPTRDADLLGIGELGDDEIAAIFKEVCTVPVEADASAFDPASVRVTPIREADEYGGRRVTLRGAVGSARVSIQVDIGIGDAVTPAPECIDYPSMLGFPKPRLRAYTRETVVAEKLHAIVVLGLANSRMKDYFDVLALLREDAIDRALLVSAIVATFARRRTSIPGNMPVGLSDDFAADSAKRQQWAGFLKKNRLDAPALDEVVREVRDFVDGPLRLARGSEADT